MAGHLPTPVVAIESGEDVGCTSDSTQVGATNSAYSQHT
jgi:hypothetical protein